MEPLLLPAPGQGASPLLESPRKPDPTRFAPYLQLSLQTLASHQTFFSNLVLLFLTYAGEEFFEKFAFSCPCNHDQAYHYALVFLVVPAVIFFFIGVVVRNATAMLCEGWWQRRKRQEEEKKRQKEEKKIQKEEKKKTENQQTSKQAENQIKSTSSHCCICWGEILFKSLLVPVAWALLCLMDGDYYACMTAMDPCNSESDDYKDAKSFSKLVFWYTSLTVIIIIVVAILFAKCCKERTYLHNRYMERLSDIEKQEIEANLTKHAVEMVQNEAKVFLVADLLDKADWDRLSMIDPLQFARPIQTLLEDRPEKFKKMKDELEKPIKEPVPELNAEPVSEVQG